MTLPLFILISWFVGMGICMIFKMFRSEDGFKVACILNMSLICILCILISLLDKDVYYRVVTDGKVYEVEYKYGLLSPKNRTYRSFNSLQEADKYITQHKKDRVGIKTQDSKKWKKVN